LILNDLRRHLRVAVGWPWLVIALFMAGGCGQRDEITRYEVLKPEVVDPTLAARPASAASPATKQQTLGLIVLIEDVGWFFKLTGDAAAVAPQHENFLRFTTSIEFAGGAAPKPTWTLPEGWRELPGREMRFATIQIEADGKPLELSVIPLPVIGGDEQKYVLDNINRWRQQLQLGPVSADELPATTKKLTVGGREATLVSLVGTGGRGMGGAPFAPFAGGTLPPDHPPIGEARQSASEARKSP
jgi:hypothetical protein